MGKKLEEIDELAIFDRATEITLECSDIGKQISGFAPNMKEVLTAEPDSFTRKKIVLTYVDSLKQHVPPDTVDKLDNLVTDLRSSIDSYLKAYVPCRRKRSCY